MVRASAPATRRRGPFAGAAPVRAGSASAARRAGLGRPLPRSFYRRPVLRVARDVLGRLLVHAGAGGVTAGRVVEVEAYRGDRDPASHAFRGLTRRNAVMFGPAGHAYVYFTYGMHYCLNLVTGPEGSAAALLVRALEPVVGLELMRARRGVTERERLARGPACVTQALGVGPEHNGADLVGGRLWVSDRPASLGGYRAARGPRVGIRRGTELPWRIYLDGHPCVSARRREPRPATRAARVRDPR
jgi:DNA-3-methyladenine glycosylase